MIDRHVVRLFIVSLAILCVGAVSRSAYATVSIQTFGGETFFQSGNPTQYVLCLSFSGGSRQVYSDYCSGASQFSWDGVHVTTVSGGSTYYMTNHGTTVTMDASDSSTDQEWVVDGSNLVSSKDSNCLDVNGANTASGTKLDVATCNGTSAQWIWLPENMYLRAYTGVNCLAETSTGGYNIEPCCDVNTCTTAQKNAQSFAFTIDNYIENTSSGKCLEQSSGSAVQATCSLSNSYDFWTDGQQWPNNGHTYVWGFFMDYGGTCLDVFGAGYGTAGTTVDTYTCGGNGYNGGAGNLAQFWQVTPR